jgi:hypothetical protein
MKKEVIEKIIRSIKGDNLSEFETIISTLRVNNIGEKVIQTFF